MARFYKNIEAYQLGYSFVLEVYKFTNDFPLEERGNITSQIRRASVSIPLNIAEGSAKASQKEFVHYLNTAFASGKEVEVLLQLSLDLGYFDKAGYEQVAASLDKLNAKLFLFIRSIESRITGKRYKFFKEFEKKNADEIR
jgi:four helix bundle protein